MDETDLITPTPRIGVVICGCGGKISDEIDTETLRRQAGKMPGVVWTHQEAFPCSRDGQARLCQAIQEQGLDRVLIAGCAPRLMENLFRKAVEPVGLDKSFINVANIREGVAFVGGGRQEQILEKALAAVDAGVARLATTSAAPIVHGKVVKAALVLGSGLSGLTVALVLADNGIQVTLVEPADEIGPVTSSMEQRTRELIEERRAILLKHPRIEALAGAQLVEVNGHPGDYDVRLRYKNKVIHYAVGSIIASNAAQPKQLGAEQWFDRSRVKTQAEFESELQAAATNGDGLPFENIVMVFCADPSQRERCSRVCCNQGISQAVRAKELNPEANVTVFFRDLYLGGIGEQYELDFMQARKLGVTFFRYRQDHPPILSADKVEVLDTLTGVPVRLAYDRAVLSMPLVPQENTRALAAILGLPEDEAGFLAEPRLRLRPGRYADPGIYILGSSQQPADTHEALFQAYLTSSRALRFLSQEAISVETTVAEIDPALCTGCGNCPRVCPTQAIHLEKRDGVLSVSEVDELRCIGCGNCVVVCPVKAISLPGWDNVEIPAQIAAVLQPHIAKNGKPNVVVLACEWSAYAAADMAGHRHIPYPANVRIIRMNCSARFDPYHILWAFINGADGVFLGACPPGECHYGTGNLFAKERVEVLKKELSAHGINPSRLHLEYLSADEGEKFAQAVQGFVEEVGGG